MFEVTALPALNAILNSIATILLLVGYVLIRQGRITSHRRCMLAAFFVSVIFLTSYLVYHFQVGSQPFTGQGAIRVLYFSILISHVILAASIPPLAIPGFPVGFSHARPSGTATIVLAPLSTR